MNTVELFCGNKSFSNYASKIGHNTYTVDIDETYNPDLIVDLSHPISKHLRAIIEDALYLCKLKINSRYGGDYEIN